MLLLVQSAGGPWVVLKSPFVLDAAAADDDDVDDVAFNTDRSLLISDDLLDSCEAGCVDTVDDGAVYVRVGGSSSDLSTSPT